MLTQEYLKSILHYCPNSGVFTHITQRMKGNRADLPSGQGYRKIYINRKRYYAHRIAWIMVYNTAPSFFIDHINGIRDDNRLSNLREADYTQSAGNSKIRNTNKLGIKGVVRSANGRRYYVHFRNQYIGVYDCPIEAGNVYKKLISDAYGEYAPARS
jgi:HNH endonuclease